MKLIGWRKVETKYCQIVTKVNRVKRFIFAYMCKLFNKTFDAIDANKMTIELQTKIIESIY